MTRQKQAYLFMHRNPAASINPFWERRLLWKTEAARLGNLFGNDSIKGPYPPEDDTIVSGFCQTKSYLDLD